MQDEAKRNRRGRRPDGAHRACPIPIRRARDVTSCAAPAPLRDTERMKALPP